MRYLTAGESHGKALVGIIEGVPAGLTIDMKIINDFLFARQSVEGRGERSHSLCDEAEILSGLNGSVTTGAPIAVIIDNKGSKIGGFDFYRPGHVDYAADVKYNYGDASLGSERGSARETAMRSALGAIALQLLDELDISITARVVQIGDLKTEKIFELDKRTMCDISYSKELREKFAQAAKRGDTLGGKIKLTISGLKAGIGSHVFYDRRLDCLLGGALMSIPSVKAVESGLGVGFATLSGRQAADEWENGSRKSNNCGGTEGGISNGEDIVFYLTAKPVPSISGLKTIDGNGNSAVTEKVRGDVCAVPAICIVAEAVAALEITKALLDCLGGDTMDELKERYAAKGALCKRSL